LHHEQRKAWREEVEKQWNKRPISLPRLASEIWETIGNEDWVLVNGNLRGWARKLWQWTKPGQYLGGSGGAGLGYGMPAAIGAALAHKNSDKLCVNIQSDGDLLYSSSSILTAAYHKIPLLTVMHNNRVYCNSMLHRKDVVETRKRAANLTGTLIDNPPVDYAKLARSMGMEAINSIEDPEELKPALEKAKTIVKKNKRPVLIDVITQPM
jgi:thiamine pyrophosphate-dependent acetolactate synthase large subunit-like protein